MFGTNEHILAIYDTKNDVLVSNTVSLENVQSYTVSFHIVESGNAGAGADQVNLTIEGVPPSVTLNSVQTEATYPTIVPENPFDTLAPDNFIIWSSTGTALTSVNQSAVSDSGFGYKAITASITNTAATSGDQFLVVAILHTTKAPN